MADDTKRMNVLYSSDDNYAQHMGVSIYSLLRHNAEFENIRLYVIDNDISPENRDKLREMVSRFPNAEIMFLPFLEWKEKLRLNMSWDISISSYARLFVGEMLPETVDRVLYADCDMIVCEPLREHGTRHWTARCWRRCRTASARTPRRPLDCRPECAISTRDCF